MNKKDRALQDLLDAARMIRRVNAERAEYTRSLMMAAQVARATGIPGKRPPLRAFDYGNGVDALIDALDRYEKNKGEAPK